MYRGSNQIQLISLPNTVALTSCMPVGFEANVTTLVAGTTTSLAAHMRIPNFANATIMSWNANAAQLTGVFPSYSVTLASYTTDSVVLEIGIDIPGAPFAGAAFLPVINRQLVIVQDFTSVPPSSFGNNPTIVPFVDVESPGSYLEPNRLIGFFDNNNALQVYDVNHGMPFQPVIQHSEFSTVPFARTSTTFASILLFLTAATFQLIPRWELQLFCWLATTRMPCWSESPASPI